MSSPPAASVAIEVVATCDRVVRVKVAGELDLASAPGLEELLRRELSAGGQVVLDLSGLEFMDCSGLHAILSATRHARRNGGQLKRTAALPKQARRLLELAGAENALAVSPD
jgi:anti-anti-sigma factor